MSFLNIFLFLLKKKKCHDSITLKSCESRCNFAPLDSISIALPHPFPKARTCTKYFPKKSTKNVVLHFTLSKRSLVFCLCVSALENHLLIKGCSHILLPRTPLVFHRYTLSQPPYWRGQPQMQLNSIASGLLKKEGTASVLTISTLISVIPMGGKAWYFLRSPSDWDIDWLGCLIDFRCGPEWGLCKSSSVIVKVYCFSSFMLVHSIRRWLYSDISVSSTI